MSHAWEQVIALFGTIVVGIWWALKPDEGIPDGPRQRLQVIRGHAYTIDPGMALARLIAQREAGSLAVHDGP